VRPPGLEPGQPSRTTGTLGQRVYLIPPRAQESRHPGSNRAVPRTKGEPQAVRGGMATLPGFEPGTSASRARRYCRVELEGIEYAGRDLNPHTARFELASFAG
jgi:hypothetical protein